MKIKIIFLLIFLMSLKLPLYAEDILVIGDSLAHAFPGPVCPWSALAVELGKSPSYYNDGIAGDIASSVAKRIDTALEVHSPSGVYLIVGSNDARWAGTTISSYLSSLDSILSSCRAHSAQLIMAQITPVTHNGGGHGLDETGQQQVKLFNAALEKWAYMNNIKVAPTYVQLTRNSTSYKDDLAVAYSYDGCHMTSDGYTKFCQLLAHAAIPIKKRIWGDTSFPIFAHEGWSYWILSGTASITDDADTGTLSLAQNATADSTVQCIDSSGSNISLSATILQGSVNLRYRTLATNFNRDYSGSWTTYSSPFTTKNQFIQIRIENTGATEALVSDVTLSWAPEEPNSIPPTSLHNMRPLLNLNILFGRIW
jgi:lysophospholipase L1-like esterase